LAILIGLRQYPVAHGVVGDVVTEGLGHAPEAFTADRNHWLASFLGLFAGDGFDVVSNQAHRTF
jgi:hypothetical protein